MLKIDHIAIYAKNILCLSEFYIQTFGFVETNRKYHEDGKIKMIGLKVNETQMIELFNFDRDDHNLNQGYVNSGYMHLGFEIYDLNSFLVGVNSNIIEQNFIGTDGIHHIFIRDPEKNLIELSEQHT